MVVRLPIISVSCLLGRSPKLGARMLIHARISICLSTKPPLTCSIRVGLIGFRIHCLKASSWVPELLLLMLVLNLMCSPVRVLGVVAGGWASLLR